MRWYHYVILILSFSFLSGVFTGVTRSFLDGPEGCVIEANDDGTGYIITCNDR